MHMLVLVYTRHLEKALLEEYCDRTLFMLLKYNQYIHAILCCLDSRRGGYCSAA